MQIIALIIALFLINIKTYCQTEKDFNEKRYYSEANQFMLYKNYSAALAPLLQIHEKYPENSNITYMIGLCFLHSDLDKDKSINYFLKVLQDTIRQYQEGDFSIRKAPLCSYFYLGKAYHYTYQFEKAIEMFQKYKSFLEIDNPFQKEMENLIEICQNAPPIVNNPIEIEITNLGKIINTVHEEHSPVINTDETLLIFTSRRENSTGGQLTNDGRYFEDIYISRKIQGEWSSAQPISPNINTDDHEASIGLSPDGKELFIYKNDFGNGNIYYSRIDSSNKWAAPVKLTEKINTPYHETHASVSTDGNQIYFTSDRPGGYGGQDIYVIKKLPNGVWGDPQNLGVKINTPYNEEGPYIHPDGVTLFFSSQGHNTIGGYDIFTSVIDNENRTCSEPVNMGYPINTTENEMFYTLSGNGETAYFATIRKEGIGGRDIYTMNLLSTPEKSYSVVTGKIAVSGNVSQGSGFEITVTDLSTGKIIGNYLPNKNTDVYTMVLMQGKEYKLQSREGYRFEKDIIKIPYKTSFYQLHRPIELFPIATIIAE